MAFIDDQQRVLRQVFEQRGRRLAGIAAGEIARVVLDALAGTGGLHHLDIEGRALLQPFDLQQLALGGQLRQPLLQLHLDVADRLGQRRPRRDVVAVGVDRDLAQFRSLLAGQRIEFVDRLHLVAEQRDAPGAILVVAREDVHAIATQPERAALEGGVVAAVLQIDQPLRQRIAIDPPAGLELHHHPRIGLDRADAVDAGDRGDDHDVVAFQQRLGRGVTHPVDLLVDLRVLLYVGVGARDVGFRLVVVVI